MTTEAGTRGRGKVADAIAAAMHASGVRFAFGIPGNDVLELVRACTDCGIRFVLAKSETGAAFMADAVTQVTGAPAACIFALGPGIANGASGIAGTLQERAPIIVLGGEMAGDRREIYNHQAFDHVGFLRPVTKYAAELNAARAGQQAQRALDIALAHPRGPVFLNCPADATRSPARPASADDRPVEIVAASAGPRVIADLAAALEAASRPLALVGLGALAEPAAAAAIAEFLRAWQVPTLTTYKAKGVLPETDPLALGAIGLSPVVDAVTMPPLGESDLILAIGFDPIELRDAWLDALPAAPGRVVTIDHYGQTHRVFATGRQIVGDVAGTMRSLAANARPAAAWAPERLAGVRAAIAAITRPRAAAQGVSPAALFHAVSRHIAPDLRLSVDVGAHRILANHVLTCLTPGQLLQSNGLGHMGYAIPAAIGAALASGGPAVAMLGDACALMSLGELALVAELGLPIVVVVLVDDDLALIDLKQNKLDMARQGVAFRSPDFATIARGFGLGATAVATPDAFETAYAEALGAARTSGRPHLIAARVDPREYWDQM
jgi:acetolactate synthase-1/2/3 large subunit